MMSPSVGASFPEGWQARAPGRWLADWRAQELDLGDGTTQVVTMGEGPTLLLLPPLPGYKEAYLALAPRLARAFRVVTYDLRARFSGPPSWDTLLRDLERVADAFAPGGCAVLGHSLGGALAQRWALARPERVPALVLSSAFAHVGAPRGHLWKRYVEQPVVLAALRWGPGAWAGRVTRGFARRGVWVLDPSCDDSVLALVLHGVRRMPIGLARQCVRLAFAHDLRTDLHRLSAPTLLIVGERETAWAHAAQVQLATLLPRTERRVSPGVAHLHPLSSPDWLADTVLTWLGAQRA